MAEVIFYEKPGCINNTKQKQWLAVAGHHVIAKDILTTSWNKQELALFFKGKSVPDWFNRTAPRIKSKEIIPEEFDEQTALEIMVTDPILIKRPLIQVEDKRTQGFDKVFIDNWIGLSPLKGNESIVQTLEKDDLTLCPMLAKETSCDDEKNKKGV